MSFPNAVSSDEARQRWHTEARERDEAYLALGPVDNTELPANEWMGWTWTAIYWRMSQT